MTRDPLSMETIVREVVAGFAASVAQRDLTCEIAAPATDLVVEGDAGRLSQIVGNIMDNAIRYATPGTVIRITLARRGARVRVATHNTGDAIDDASLPHIFERFFRADPSRTRGSGGAGIGLAIVKELATAHDGDVGANNEDEGVTVWFELPLWDPDAEQGIRTDRARTVTSLDAAGRA
jgi:signal transduction histidine kinase